MSLLTIVQKTARRIGITAPSAVVTSTDVQVRQLFELANEEGLALSKRALWQALQREWSFVTVAAEVQTNTPIPADLDRFVANTFFNRTTQRQVDGPLTPQQWQAIQAQPVFGRVYLAFREREGVFRITPQPPAGETIAYEYVSTSWVMSSASQGKAEFTADDDSSYLSEELIIQGLRWRWKQAKGLPYAEDMETYERIVSKAIGEDGGASSLSIAGIDAFPWRPNVPESGFGA